MSRQQDFSIERQTDLTVRVELRPPAPVGGKSLTFTLAHRFGSDSPYFVKYAASGYYGVSGIAVVNSGQGVLDVTVRAQDTSGLDFGSHAYEVRDATSGSANVVSQGYLVLKPTMGQ